MGTAVGIDFPMFEDDGEGGLTAMHHPFTSPKDMTAAELKAAPENAVANAYDMVINGYEVGGGSYVSIMVICSRRCLVFWVSTKRTAREIRLPARRSEIRYSAARGLAFGLDRLTMLLTAPTISVTLSPSRKPRRQRV
ncbi:amino acid--tRNA ligase-related protein [Escherichia coli]|uniref:amino acid--tRNA ligase-related protein n=1 Tax=Escherichia coli TaxID=562 RepID=UPI0039A6D2DC